MFAKDEKYEDLSDNEIIQLFKGSDEVKSDIDMVVNQMRQYCFYKAVPGGREFTCTSCKETFTLLNLRRTDTQVERDALNASHDENGKCPKCGRYVTFKSDGRAGKAILLQSNRNVAFIYTLAENLCVICCLGINRTFPQHYRVSGVSSYFDTIYILRPGEGVKYDIWGDRAYRNTVNTSDNYGPFFHYGMFANHEGYTVYYKERLKDCFLRYSAVEIFTKYNDFSVCDYLYAYCSHPQFEYLMNNGYEAIVSACVLKKQYFKKTFNWDEKGRKFFRNATDCKELLTCKYPDECISIRDYYKSYIRLPLSDCEKLIFGKTDKVKKYIRRYRKDPLKAERYFEKLHEKEKADTRNMCHAAIYYRQDVVDMWKDYADMAEQLHYDLTQDVVFFPKDLNKAHDDASDVLSAIKAKEEAKKRKEENEKAKKLYKGRCESFEFSDDNYIVVIPPELQDIIREGQRQRNCVASYCSHHAEGALTIVFIRRKSDPDKNYITVELSKDWAIVQAHTYRNGLPDEAAKEFIEKYKKELIKRKKKMSKGVENGKSCAVAS